ncbi:hypothetical protein [Nocardia alni]|uniref:hypothetical protein n=1 Tax=Nocardia alni TaxID=2815723 RepID=UPI001C24C892|nr:hypothetical protein [Nocardia alni]
MSRTLRGARTTAVTLSPFNENSTETRQFVIASDRLVRSVFDVGLRLNRLQAVIDHSGAADPGATRTAIVDVRADLDRLINEAALVVLLSSRGQGETY